MTDQRCLQILRRGEAVCIQFFHRMTLGFQHRESKRASIFQCCKEHCIDIATNLLTIAEAGMLPPCLETERDF